MITKENNNTALKAETAPSPFDWTKEYIVSREDAEKIANPKWIIEDLVISGHVILIPAEPNAGKTTLFFSLAGEMVEKGYKVYYVNSDVSGGDAKYYITHAERMKIELLLPDLKVGKSMNKIIKSLMEMLDSDIQFSNNIFIFDTLKKMVDVLSKSKAKKLFKLLRKLSAKGMTVILECPHKNGGF